MRADLASTHNAHQPVTHWITALRHGDNEAAAQGLWRSYFPRLRGLARKLLRGRARRTCDGEDVAASVFRTFFGHARAGDFSRLHTRKDLWPLLAALTSNKCVDRMRREGRAKRGGRAAAVELSRFAHVPGTADGPLSHAQCEDLRDRLFALLDQTRDPALAQIARWKLDGETIEAIARRLGCVRRTVERKLRLIREVYEGTRS
jgi:RNA polymerase sigma factor (sigma-70 family)